MMKDSIKAHFQRYMFHYFIVFLILIGIMIVGIYLVKDIHENKKANSDFYYYEERIREVYKVNPSFFKFNPDGVAIVKVDELIEESTDSIGIGIIPVDKDQNQCVGYILVKKINNSEIDIDTSHFCDMIDY